MHGSVSLIGINVVYLSKFFVRLVFPFIQSNLSWIFLSEIKLRWKFGYSPPRLIYSVLVIVESYGKRYKLLTFTTVI